MPRKADRKFIDKFTGDPRTVAGVPVSIPADAGLFVSGATIEPCAGYSGTVVEYIPKAGLVVIDIESDDRVIAEVSRITFNERRKGERRSPKKGRR